MLAVSEFDRFKVSPVTGFVPATDPLRRLPPYYAPWEEVAAELGNLIYTGQLRLRVERMPLLTLEGLADERARQRAMLLLSFIGNGYVWSEEEAAAVLPAAIAVPWWKLGEQLGRPAIGAHESMVLNNWRRLDPEGPVALENLVTLVNFGAGPDEQWFYLVTTQIELDGAPALPALVRAKAAAAAGNPEEVTDQLLVVATATEQMLATLNRMVEKCDPYIFYHRVRPFFTGWPEPGLIYEGVSAEPQVLIGGSAAQSSLVQALDVALGVAHPSERTGPFLRKMREYMPREHRRFLEALAAGPAVQPFVAGSAAAEPRLAAAYDACIAQLAAFRQKHIEISVRYIVHQAPDREQAKGTGGTNFVPFLSEARKETRRQQMGDS